MCIIMYKSAKVNKIPKEYIENACYRNPDMFGIACQKNKGKVYIEKGFKTFEELYKAYKVWEDKGGYDIMIHARIKTHGAVNTLNCHPFALGKRKADLEFNKGFVSNVYCHNGQIDSIDVPKTSTTSDTYEFGYRIVANLLPLPNSNIKTIISNLEPYSKFCLFREGHFPLLIGDFVEEDGVMFSNTSYKGYTSYYSYSNNTCLLKFKNLNSETYNDVFYWLDDNGYDISDCYDVGEYTYYNVDRVPVVDKICGHTFESYN